MDPRPILCLALALVLAGPALAADAAAAAALDKKTAAIIERDFHAKGIARADRVKQDELQRLCTQFHDQPPQKIAERVERAQQAAIKWPADGSYLGDWRAGEKLAQSGAGMTWSDPAGTPAGGNCYNCHQLSAKEIAFGTIGPSLLHFGRSRGNTPETQRYVYARIYNAKAQNMCANMPRFGHLAILSEAQIKDLVSLLLDPESPVNKD